ncbi:MAG: hypothetical protein ACPH5Z_01300 [Flavobacteriaceae bacterium]
MATIGKPIGQCRSFTTRPAEVANCLLASRHSHLGLGGTNRTMGQQRQTAPMGMEPPRFGVLGYSIPLERKDNKKVKQAVEAYQNSLKN